MHRKWLNVLGLLCLAGCSGEVSELQRQYNTMKAAGVSAEELCQQSQKIAQAMLEAGDDREYRLQKIIADGECQSIALDRLRAGV